MKPIEHDTNTASTTKTGLFVMLRGLFYVRGSGASKIGLGSGVSSFRRVLVTLATVAMTLVALAFTVAPAVAAAPEAPTLTVEEPVHATEAIVHGVLDPTKEGEPGTYEVGTYQFLYKASKTKACEGGSVAPASPGMSLGGGKEEFSEVLSPLNAATEYAVCLEVETAGGKTVSAPVTFKTALPPEKPETTSPAKLITATTATFEGALNPKKAGEAGSYEFLYRVSPTECEGERASPTEPSGVMSGAAKQAVSVAVTALQPNAKYTFCLLARNTAGETSVGNAVYFTTPPAPPTIENESVSNVKASEARLEGTVNPNNEVTVCQFQYESEEPLLATPTTTLCEPGALAASFGGQGVGLNVSGLESGKSYYYRVIGENEQSRKEGKSEEGKIKHFTTAIPVEAPEGLKAEPIGATTATLHGVLNPSNKGEEGSYQFAYRRSASECQVQGENPNTHQQEEVNEHVTPEEHSIGGQGEEAKPAQITGLLPNVQYTFCLIAHNNAGETSVSSPVTFTTGTEAPSVIATTLSHLGSSGVTVEGQIAPGGLETSYSVQYGTSTTYGSQTTHVNISPSTSSATVSVTVPLTELAASTAYHLRLVVANTDGGAVGSDQAFTTYTAGTSVLPDGRVYEMVTPPENENANVYELVEGPLLTTFHPFQAAADGNSVAYVTQPTTGGNGSTGNGSGGEEDLATRSSQGGWSQVNVTPAGSSPDTVYQAFSSELSVGFLTSGQEAPFVATPTLSILPTGVQGYNDLYSRAFDESLYRPVFTAKPPYRRTEAKGSREELSNGVGPFGTAFTNSASHHDPLYAGSSANLEDRLFEANDALLAGEGPPKLEEELDADTKKEAEEVQEDIKLKQEVHGPPGPREEKERVEVLRLEAAADRDELYESIGGRLSLVNVLPDGELAPGATFGGQATAFDGEGTKNADEEADFSHDISTDGSRIFWTDLETAVTTVDRLAIEQRPGIVYVRENGTTTVPVSQGPAEFWTASSDGKYAFYTEAGRLWRFDVEDQTRTELAGAGSDVAGVIGTNETGKDSGYVYFVAGDVLASNANGGGEVATDRACEPAPGDLRYPQPGEPVYEELHGRLQAGYGCNLYVWHGGETRFIATLSAADGGDWVQAMGRRVSNITPDGQSLVFSARENFTGAPYGDEGSEEVYVYDATEGSLFCASCRPQASGGHLPTSESLVYTYRRVSEDGDQVFFDSEAPLVSRDANGVQDVYEWERNGSGGCGEADGCVYLLSGGVEGPAYLVDASVSGNDVFFVARQKLVPEDDDETANLYDARVDGVPPVPPPECSGTGCQGVPAPPPTFATPASVTFNGVGNFSPPVEAKPAVKPKPKSKPTKCRTGYVKKKGKCVKKPKPKKKQAKAKKASDDRKASR